MTYNQMPKMHYVASTDDNETLCNKLVRLCPVLPTTSAEHVTCRTCLAGLKKQHLREVIDRKKTGMEGP
jgi:hypothetical protein